MISNIIKRFLNDHFVLIVVIISILVIYFIYWWFCCKKTQKANVKGGGNPIYDDVCNRVSGGKYKCIGARCDYIYKSIQSKYYYLIVLNNNGIKMLTKMINKSKDFHLGFYLTFCVYKLGLESDDGDSNITIKPLIRDPIKLFDQSLKRSDLKYKYNGHFFLNNTLKGIACKNVIKESYYNLIDNIVENYRGCFDYVNYVGQCGRYPIAAGVHADDSIIYLKASKDVITDNNLKNIFNYFVHDNKDVREWYNSNGIAASEMNNKFFNDDDTGNIVKVDGEDKYCYILYSTLIDYICETIEKYAFEGCEFIHNPDCKKIANIQKWIRRYESKGTDDAESNLRDIVKGICANVYSMNSDGLTEIFRNVAMFNIIQDTKIIKDSIISLLPGIFMQLIKYIINGLDPNKKSLTLETIQNVVKSYISDQMKKMKELNVVQQGIIGRIMAVINDVDVLLLPQLTQCYGREMNNEILGRIERKLSDKTSNFVNGELLNLGDIASEMLTEQMQEICDMDAFSIIGKSCKMCGGKANVEEMITAKGKQYKKYDNADIYPANKLSLTILFFMLVYSNHTNIEFEEYMRMIASYVLYVNSFNTFCGVKMENLWNSGIQDAYVYKKIPNGQSENRMELDLDKVKTLEINMIFDYLNDLADKHSDLGIPDEVRNKCFEIFGENNKIYDACKECIDIICMNCGYDLYKTLSLSDELIKSELARIGRVMDGIGDKDSEEYKLWKIIQFYISGYKETEYQKLAGDFGKIKRSLSPINLSTIKSIGTLQHQSHHHHQSQTSSGFVMPFMKQFDTTCSECAIYHAIYDIDDSRYVVNEKTGVRVPLHAVSEYINEYIQNPEDKLKLNDNNGTIERNLYQTIEVFSGSHKGDVYLIDLVGSSQTGEVDVDSHIVALKTVGDDDRKIYDSRFSHSFGLTDYTGGNPSLVVSNFISLSQIQINILRDKFSKDKSNIIDYKVIEQYVNNQKAGTTEGQNPEAGPPENERIRDMNSDSVTETNRSSVNKRKMKYSDNQTIQMFLELPEDLKQKIGELIFFSLHNK